jgi:RimJ/RimL family protein N-acetyltransferase
MSCAICLKENNDFIGCIFLNHIDYHNRSAQEALFIGEKKHLGKGYGSEAILLMLKYAFLDRGLERISAIILEDNKASLRLHEKCGYVREGLLRKAGFKDGQFVNQIILSVLKEDFIKVLENYEL